MPRAAKDAKDAKPAKSKPADAPPPPRNTAERQARNDQIIELVARGVSKARVARVVNVTRQTVYDVLEEHRQTGPRLRQHKPLEIVDQMLEGYQADLEELAAVSSATTNESVRVGAIRSRMDARDRIVALLQATGVLPHDLGKLRIDIDVRYISQQLLVILDKYDVPVAAKKELAELLGSTQAADAVPANN
jgi:hypothetical protein